MGGRTAGRSYHELTDRIAREMGWTALVFNYRGCGRSTGQFSLGNWLADTAAAIDELASHEEVSGIWVCGFGTGGALAICAAAADARVRGVAAVAPPADFTDWAAAPERLLKHAHELGIMARRDPDDFESWAAELGSIRAEACAAELAPRPLLVIHGSADEAVPVFDSRAIANSHGGADLRIIAGAGHRLRFDPRAVAILLGWLDRQRHRVGFTAR
jgi:putative redox protein